MLAVGKYVVSVEVSHDVADNYMFKHLTADEGKRYRPDGWAALPNGATGLSAVCDCGISWSYSFTISVVTGFSPFLYIVETLDFRQTSGIDPVSRHFW